MQDPFLVPTSTHTQATHWGWLAWRRAGLWLAYGLLFFVTLCYLALFCLLDALLAYWLGELTRSQRRSQPGAEYIKTNIKVLKYFPSTSQKFAGIHRNP